MIDITGQVHGLTNWLDPQVTARWAPKQDKSHPVMLDWQTRPEVLIDLEMGYAANGAMAAARTADNIIATAVTGSAAQGPTGATSSAFNTTGITPATAATTLGNVLAAGGTGLTVNKVRQARGIFDAREVGVDDRANGIREAFVWIVNAGAMQQLLGETEAINKDYVQDAPLTEGTIIYFMGFTWVIYNNLTNTTGTTYRTLAWHRDAMGFALWKERDLFIDRLPEHQNATGVNYMCSILNDSKVPCDSDVTVNTGINGKSLVANDYETIPYQARHAA